MTVAIIIGGLGRPPPKGSFGFHSTLGVSRPVPSKSSPEGVLAKSLEQVQCDANAGMPRVVQVIAASGVFDIHVVIAVPVGWPGLVVSEPIAIVLESVVPLDHPGTHHAERVVTAKMGPVMLVRDAAIMVAIVAVTVETVVAMVVGNGA